MILVGKFIQKKKLFLIIIKILEKRFYEPELYKEHKKLVRLLKREIYNLKMLK